MKCCQFSLGDMRIPITLAHVTRTNDGLGGWTESEAAYATPLASVRFKSLSQRVRMGFTDERKIAEVVLRYRTDILETDVITVDSVKYSIVGLDNLEMRNRWTVLTLQEVPH